MKHIFSKSVFWTTEAGSLTPCKGISWVLVRLTTCKRSTNSLPRQSLTTPFIEPPLTPSYTNFKHFFPPKRVSSCKSVNPFRALPPPPILFSHTNPSNFAPIRRTIKTEKKRNKEKKKKRLGLALLVAETLFWTTESGSLTPLQSPQTPPYTNFKQICPQQRVCSCKSVNTKIVGITLFLFCNIFFLACIRRPWYRVALFFIFFKHQLWGEGWSSSSHHHP